MESENIFNMMGGKEVSGSDKYKLSPEAKKLFTANSNKSSPKLGTILKTAKKLKEKSEKITLLNKHFGKEVFKGKNVGKGLVALGWLTLLSPMAGLGGLAFMIIKLTGNKKNWKTNENAPEAEKSRRSAQRGQLISLCLMVLAGGQAMIKALKPNDKALLVLYGFIFASVIGYIGDQMVGGDDGQSFMKYVNPITNKKEKPSTAHWIRYGLASLTTGSFFRYLLTVFLDMFISGCMIDVFQVLATPLTNWLKTAPENPSGKYNPAYWIGPGTAWGKFLSGNFDNILQSVVAFATFMAYTNDTRFNWAYPPNTAKREDIIPIPTIKLVTSVAAIVYLVANIPKNNSRKLNFIPGKPMADSLGVKLLYVCITLGLLTMGSQGVLFNLDPLKERKKLKEKLEKDDKDGKKYVGKQKWFITKKKWKMGAGILFGIFLLGIGVPLFTANFMNNKRITKGFLCIAISAIIPVILASIAASGKDKWQNERIEIEKQYAMQLKLNQKEKDLAKKNGWEETKDGKYKKNNVIKTLKEVIKEIFNAKGYSKIANNKWKNNKSTLSYSDTLTQVDNTTTATTTTNTLTGTTLTGNTTNTVGSAK